MSGNFGWEFPFGKNVTGCLTFTQNFRIDAQRLTRGMAEGDKKSETRTKYVKRVNGTLNGTSHTEKYDYLFRISLRPRNFPMELAKRLRSTIHLNQNFREILVNGKQQGRYLP